MPLAHSAFRPLPVVEFLGLRTISIEEAAAGLERSLAGGGDGAGQALQVPGSSLVNFRQIPNIVASLKDDWASLPAAERSKTACFVEVSGRLEAHMHPCFLGDRMMEGMRAAAGALLLRFSSLLKCVPLGFKRLEPAGKFGGIVAESPYVHFLIAFDAIGFQPRPKQRLLGRARPPESQTATGINIEILNAFNFFVKKSQVPPGVAFAEGSGWTVEVNGGRRSPFAVSRPVWVEITEKVVQGSMQHPLSFRGVLCPESMPGASEDAASSPRKARRREGAEGTEAAAPAEAAAAEAPEQPHKRKKRKADLAAAEAAEAPAAGQKAPPSAPEEDGRKAPKRARQSPPEAPEALVTAPVDADKPRPKARKDKASRAKAAKA